jgi:RNA polymerase sigma factor (sigma-70 family)
MSRFWRPLARVFEPSADDEAASRGPDELRRIAAAAAAGDADAARTLVMHVGGAMLAVIRKVLGGGSPDVDDVAQEAVIGLLGALGTFRGDCTIVHFAHRIALLKALAARRQIRHRARTTDGADEVIAELPDPGAQSPLALVVASRRRLLLRRLLDELPEPTAEALALHFILGYTVDEIADAASVSSNTVWSRLRLGKQALRRKLDGDRRLVEMLREQG